MKASALLALPSALLAQAPPSASPQAEVERTFHRFIDAFNALDWEGFRACLSDEVSLFNPDLPEVSTLARLDGRAEVERAYAAVFAAARKAGSGPHIVPRHLRLQTMPETALVSFEFDRGGGSFGRRTLVFRKEQGAWRILHIHASNALPRP
jgi:ketosteroid isomerase-like protein